MPLIRRVRNLQAALRSLVESWQRTVLSAIGVMVASVAIILLVSIGLGVQKDVRGQVEDLGANVVVVVPGRVQMSGGFNPNLGGQSWFKESDGDALRQVPGVARVATLSFAGGGIRYGDLDAYPFMVATTPDWFVMHRVQVGSGRLFTDEDAGEPVVVLGSIAAKQLFGDEPALGKRVTVNKLEHTVIGVTKDRNSEESLFAMQGFQNVAYIPFASLRRASPSAQIDRFMVLTDPEAEPKALVKALDETLAGRLDRSQFSVLTQEDLLGLIYQVIGILGTLVVGLTSIALFVGGVGIMTVMLMAVNERRKEIGVRKAMGARRRDVFWQFLVESALIGVLGVLVGLVVSAVVCWWLAENTKIKPLLTAETVALAFAMGVGVGSVFGLIPALRAASQDPVVSLRNE